MLAVLESPSRTTLDPILKVESVTFRYADGPVLQDLNLKVRTGEFLTLLGASGCGKTTLLRLLAGLELPTEGHIFWNGQPVSGPSLERGIVFQEYALFPWLNLLENVALATQKANPDLKKKETRHLAGEYLEMVGLNGAARKYPHELSGGMRQRGAIARTLALGAPLLLLDEPFGALDPLNRMRLQDLLLTIWSQSQPQRTVVFVTHDIEEALYLGDRVILLGSNPGRVLGQLEVPFERPRSRTELHASPHFRNLREEVCEYYHRDAQDRLEAEGTLVHTQGEGI